jgi:4-alpha-glucanotransferase
VNFVKQSGCGLWQILPLGPTGYGDSPYQSFSAFAGNPYLVSPALLLEDDLLIGEDLADRPAFPDDTVDYGEVIQWKLTLLDRAFHRSKESPPAWLAEEMARFQSAEKFWLEDFALFMAIKESQRGVSWDSWPKPLRSRDPKALAAFRRENPEAVQRHIFRQ